jgi:hypothetical protein
MSSGIGEPRAPRVCRLCGAPLGDRRRDALYCSDAHRAEAGRIRAILSGSPTTIYPSLAHRIEASQRRTQSFWTQLWSRAFERRGQLD